MTEFQERNGVSCRSCERCILGYRGGAGNSLEKCFLNRFDQWSRHMCVCMLPIRANVSGSARR